MNTFKKLPGVMSARRTLVMSDAAMFNMFPETDGPDELKEMRVEVVRHGIRGTQNINGSEKNEVSNIQETDSAKLDSKAIGMRVDFGIRFLALRNSLSACAPSKEDSMATIKSFKDSYFNFIERAEHSDGLVEVATRYARNIANGRWLWSNRIIADGIDIHVNVNGETLIFDALAISLRNFDNYSADEKKLGRFIAESLSGEAKHTLKVSAHVKLEMGNSVEVFPSQNYLNNKPSGFAKSLYKHNKSKARDNTDINVVGYAAIRDQKVANALRTIDTWYSEFANTNEPIPVEPNGANLADQLFYRKNAKESSFNLFLKLNTIDPSTDEGMFVIASMIRGGVYSGKSDDKKETTDAASAE